MYFCSHTLIHNQSSTYANQSYQTVGYCGVPAVKPNDDLFDNLPLRSYHTQNQNHRERIYNEQVKQREESSAQEAQSDAGYAGGRLRSGGRMGPRPPYGSYGVNPQAEPYDEEQAPSMSYIEERPCFILHPSRHRTNDW